MNCAVYDPHQQISTRQMRRTSKVHDAMHIITAVECIQGKCLLNAPSIGQIFTQTNTVSQWLIANTMLDVCKANTFIKPYNTTMTHAMTARQTCRTKHLHIVPDSNGCASLSTRMIAPLSPHYITNAGLMQFYAISIHFHFFWQQCRCHPLQGRPLHWPLALRRLSCPLRLA